MQKTVELLLNMDDIGIIVHRNPDGDCLGSAFALAAALKQLGKRVKVISSDPLTKHFADIYGKIKFDDFEPLHYVSVDTATPAQMGSYEYLAAKTELAIDHHATNTRYAKYNLVFPKAAAACEIIYELIFELGCTITCEIATYLYIGIITDTGCFQFSNTSPTTHIVAADLISKGADCYELNRIFFSTKSRARMDIERMALEKLEFFENDRIALIPITIEMKEQTGADDGDLDGITPITRQIEGVEIGLTAREQADGTWRVSVRSNTYVDSSAICSEFGGGGHIHAAGCTVTGTFSEIKENLLETCRKYL